MRLRTKLAALAVGAVAATGGLVMPTTAAVAAPSGASACWSPGWSTKDGSIGHTNTNGVNIRSGPTTDCQSNGQAQTGHNLRLDCWVSGQNGTWTHVRDNTTGVSGWIKDSLLQNNGAAYWAEC
ncbi:SH3 domain-containing protein [Streptomyces sp. ISL-36]|uniref:SH3 domain-containing protein n=1 Tax=Streptomyces sp. ISL-36 TaxID=2819182 RepID=UPI001BEB9C1E|nr:SH3 domain-containing protein [Streptomyces sp. ISL-36]MBT2438815.1 SH3 domain-containing protein [Streptomyces sp. ISL-36]